MMGMELMPRTATFEEKPCACCATHVPKPLQVELHHVLPQTDQMRIWGSVKDQRLIPMCRTSHRNLHIVLELLLQGKPYPRVNEYTLLWAREGLARIRAAEKAALDGL